MCGICGLVGPTATPKALSNILNHLDHRGPDYRGLWSDDDIALGHTRLAIVDLSDAGRQPMTNEDGSVHLVANGEIYNNAALRDDLICSGHQFRSQSDNEVLLHLYEEEGPSFISKLNGMFAFAIWDARCRRLMLARDRMGIKPVYYHVRGDGIIFASEARALVTYPYTATGISPAGLAQYLTYENTFGATTLYSDILLVEPGQYLLWEEGRIEKHTYWQPSTTESAAPSKFEDACDLFLEVAQKAVKRHLMSDVEVASYLSSGFDSTTVATLAIDETDGRLSTFTGTFAQDGWYDERLGAEATAQRIGARHCNVEIGFQDLADNMDDIIFSLGSPRMGMGAFSQYMVAQKASHKFKVILTGHGGDELFAGYPVFKLAHLLRSLTSNPSKALLTLGNTPATEWPHLIYFTGRRYIGRNDDFLPNIFPWALACGGLQPSVREQLQTQHPHSGLQGILANETDPYRQLCLTYLRGYLPGLFVVEDTISMAHSLESRTPMCDNELVEMALSLPLDIKLHNGTLKAIPKAAMRNRLPGILYRQPKRGFPTPLSRWLRGPLHQWARTRLLEDNSPLHRLFRKDFLEKEFTTYISSWRRAFRPLDEIQTHRLWVLLSLEAWLRTNEERLDRKLEL